MAINLKRGAPLFLAAFVVLVLFFVVFRSRAVPRPTPTPFSSGTSYKAVVPGVSSKEEVLEKLGRPLNDSASDVLNYKSNNPNLAHQITTENNTVALIREIVDIKDAVTKDGLLTLYGNPTETLYGPDSVNGYNLYFYPQKGVAFLAHVSGPAVLEILYFAPTTTESFLSTWGKEYSRTHSPVQ